MKLSVITSSHPDMLISDMLVELWALRTYALDFYPRGEDILRALGLKDHNVLESVPLINRFAHPSEAENGAQGDKDVIQRIADYVNQEKEQAKDKIAKVFGEVVPATHFRFPAVATYFPEIASFDDGLRETAGQALRNAVRLADKLGARVVEFVIGRTVERCHCSPNGFPNGGPLRCDFVHSSEARDRIKDVVKTLRQEVCATARDHKVKLAAEIEPGFSYVLNSSDHVNLFLNEVQKAGIGDVVGLNLDIGHLLILSEYPDSSSPIAPETAMRWSKYIYHAHASDNIGHHYRDLVPGTLHSLGRDDEEVTFRDWINVCALCAKENPGFSRYIAVELEGCNRLQWVQRSLLRLAYLIRQVHSN